MSKTTLSQLEKAPKKLGFFSRVLDEASAAERYRLLGEQIIHAEKHGFDTAWLAQHHFHEFEGGLPSPLTFLAYIAAQTSRIRLGTGVICLPMESPIRVAEDAVVADLISEGRLEVGVGTGGTLESYQAFGVDSSQRGPVMARNMQLLRDAWAGNALPGGVKLYPHNATLNQRIWQATFAVEGGERAGQEGDGLLLSRTQPRPEGQPNATLSEIQQPIVDAYLAALPEGAAPRIMASRTLFVADSREEALKLADTGIRRSISRNNGLAKKQGVTETTPLPELLRAYDAHVGTPEDVLETLSQDHILKYATDIVFQVHSIDPPHPYILRSIELIADEVAPKLGWQSQTSPSHKPVRIPERLAS
ncbi:putative FMN-dependent luciferase-like monooxygenase [Microvirga sp. W0021]|uniref:FMN-dependent luciferase-like monooxygenase n=1 Tax=Hohaiivirga grylli TaxID=3133970 RepID=A0ABV0BJR3_9HYPH